MDAYVGECDRKLEMKSYYVGRALVSLIILTVNAKSGMREAS